MVAKKARTNWWKQDPSSLGLQTIYEFFDPADIVVDIVAIHGFNGDPERTWTAANGVMWLRDLLPQDQPRIRVFSWGYAGMTYPSKSVENIEDHSKTLVHDLSRKILLSETPGNRPIIFIAYDIGGIIIKRALLYSYELAHSVISNQYVPIHNLTNGVIFIATPHQNLSIYYSISHFSACFLEPFALFKRRLRGLQKDTEVLKTENEEFVQLASRCGFHLVSAYETLTTSMGFYSTIVVPIESAIIERIESELIALHANHPDATKFTARDDQNYVRLSESLALMIDRLRSLSQLKAENKRQVLLTGADEDAGPSYTQNDNEARRSSFSLESIRPRSSSDRIGIESQSYEFLSRIQQLNIRPEGVKTGTVGTTSNDERPAEEHRQISTDSQATRIIISRTNLPHDLEQSLSAPTINTNHQLTPAPQPASSSNPALPIPALSSTAETITAASSLPLKAAQVANSTAAVLDPIWTKASIVGVAATAAATVAINGVNANTARRVANISERSAAVADRAADAGEQSALAALSAADTAERKLVFDQEQSLKEKEKELGKLDGTAMKGDGNVEASKSTAQSKKVLLIGVSAKPSSTQTQFDANIRKRYEERERKKQEERDSKARNIQGFKKWVKNRFKGISSAEENNLDRELRERRNRHYENGEGVRESKRGDPKEKGKEKKIDAGSVNSSSSTSDRADTGDGECGKGEEEAPNQGPSFLPSTSTANLRFGKAGRTFAKGVLKSTLSQPSTSPAVLPQKPPNIGEQGLHQPNRRASSHTSVNLAEREDIHLDTLLLSSAKGPSASGPDPAIAEIYPENTSPVEPAALVDEAPTSKPEFLRTAINALSLEVKGQEEIKAVVTIKHASSVVSAKGGQENTP